MDIIKVSSKSAPQKVARKKRLEKICKICSECKDKSICNNRIGTDKCEKCLKCTSTYCDMFYIYTNNRASSSAKGGKKRKYLGKYEKTEEAQDSITLAQNNGFIETSNITLFEVLEKKNINNLNANNI